MYDQVMANVDCAEIFVAVAAVADWRIDCASPTKLKKTPDGPSPTLRMERNIDILAAVSSRPSPPFCVGFAAETDNVIENAKIKLRTKSVPLMLANVAQDALGSNDNEIHIVDASSVVTLKRADKLSQARRIVAEIASRLNR
jgi:phosphopantothenoylcysteine decarboxylase/phosphopantothenate--cysteine ligase